MKDIRRFFVHGWQPTLLYVIAFCALASVLFFRLGTLVPGLSEIEITAINASSSLGAIINNPLNAPHKLGQLAAMTIGLDGAVAMRAVSALFATGSAFLFFTIMRYWLTLRIAFLGTTMFVTSSWFLHTARYATPDILLSGVLALVACGLWLRFSKRRSLTWVITGLITALCLYIPGLIWFVFGFMIWQSPVIAKELRRTPPLALILSAVVFILLLAPLVSAVARDTNLLKTLVGLPNDFVGWQAFGVNLLSVPVQLFARGPDNPAIWLGRLPVLDVFSIAMFGLGIYGFYFRRRLDRIKLLAGAFLLGTILIALGGPVSLMILIPFIYIVIASGLSLMLQRWFTVFPRNPLAQGVGFFILTIAVLLSVAYNGARYFVAWPAAPATKMAFDQKR